MPWDMSQPGFVLVPGAWHRSLSFSPLISYLTKYGYIVEGVALASVDSCSPQVDFDADVEAIASALTKHVDEGADVIVLYSRSY